jgi:aspartate aminotransferase
MKRLLAERTACVDASGIRKVFALAASLRDPVDFSIGQPDFDVPQAIKAAAIAAVDGGANRYSQTAGEASLVNAIRGDLKARHGWDDPKVLVTSGVSGGLLLAFLTLIDPGDEVVIPDPYFVIYKQIVKMIGGRCVFVSSYPDFRLPLKGIANAVTDKTKLIILNSPANPTGVVCTQDEIRQLAGIAAAADALVLSDEIYDAFSYDGPCASISDFYPKTLLLKGFGKSYGMTGWRLGYATGPAEVIEQMTKLQQYTFVCAPTPLQQGAAAALDCDISEHVAAYRRKRDMVYAGLKDLYDLTMPQGAFYTFVKVPDWAGSGAKFVEKAIANNLLIIPGGVFSERDTHFRISYATTDQKINQGIEILRMLATG